MYKKLLPALLLLFAGKVMAYEFPIEITEYIDDVKVIAYVNKADIDESMHWSPFEGPPPLSIEQALQAVQHFVDSNADFANTSLAGIELKRIPHHETHWHYLVKMKHKGAEQPRWHFFVVLMNGKAIAAIREPDAIK